MTQLFAMPHQVNSEIQRSEPMALLILTAQISELQLNHWHSRSTYTIMACSSNETTSSSLTTSYWSNLGTSSTKRKHGQVQFRSTDRTCSRESWQSKRSISSTGARELRAAATCKKDRVYYTLKKGMIWSGSGYGGEFPRRAHWNTNRELLVSASRFCFAPTSKMIPIWRPYLTWYPA
jgi:hypothetical protein